MSALELDHVTVTMTERTVLHDVSLRLSTSDLITIVGPNGAGKTTLLRCALGLLKPASGEVTLDRTPVHALRGRARAARLGWLPQRLSVVEPITASELVSASRFHFGETHERSREAARRALARVNADAFEDRRLTELSGGEIQRVAIASLLAQNTPLILLDEPASHLDPAWQMEIYALIGRLWRSGLGVLWVTHDINAVGYAIDAKEASRVLVVGLKEGRVAFATSYDDADLDARLEELFDVRMNAATVGGRRVFVSEQLAGEQRS